MDRMPAVPLPAAVQPGWLVRLWQRVRKPRTVRYFVAYSFWSKQYINSAESKPGLGHCVLDVRGSIDSWEKVCAVQALVAKNVAEQANVTVVTSVRIDNFIAINQF